MIKDRGITDTAIMRYHKIKIKGMEQYNKMTSTICGKDKMKRETKTKKILDRLKLLNDEELQTVYIMVALMIKVKNFLSKQNSNSA